MLSFAQMPTSRNLPKRTDSLASKPQSQSRSQSPASSLTSTTKDQAIFAAVEDDLRDARRVHSHGQEEDLRLALSRMIDRVSELTTILKEAQKQHTDLETSLNLARSNLQLLMSNNEMLEEALARSSTNSSASVGWRRWSTKEGLEREQGLGLGLGTVGGKEEERPRSLDYSASTSGGSGSGATSPVPAPPSPASTPASSQDSRFFRFRFNSSSNTSNGTKASASSSKSATPTRSRSPTQSPVVPSTSPSQPSHLTSNSMPSLVAPAHSSSAKEIERAKELQTLLESERKLLEKEREEREKERKEREKAEKAKEALEAEIESLSQALFEEANKMVAHERIKRAETEEELHEARMEKEALRSALRVVEGENGRLRSVREEQDESAIEDRIGENGEKEEDTNTIKIESSSISLGDRSSLSPSASAYLSVSSLPGSISPPPSLDGDSDSESQQVTLESEIVPTSVPEPTPEDARAPSPTPSPSLPPPTTSLSPEILHEPSPWAD